MQNGGSVKLVFCCAIIRVLSVVLLHEAVLLFVCLCIDIMVLDSYFLSSSLVIDFFFRFFWIMLTILYAAHYLAGLYCFVTMMGHAVGW